MAIPTYLMGVDQVWEGQRDLRSRCAQGGCLMLNPTGTGPVLASLKSIKANVEILAVITQRMAQHGRIASAGVDALSSVVLDFYVAANFPMDALAPSLAHQDAWGIKRCLTFLRRKWGRREVARDTFSRLRCFNLCMWFFCLGSFAYRFWHI